MFTPVLDVVPQLPLLPSANVGLVRKRMFQRCSIDSCCAGRLTILRRRLFGSAAACISEHLNLIGRTGEQLTSDGYAE